MDQGWEAGIPCASFWLPFGWSDVNVSWHTQVWSWSQGKTTKWPHWSAVLHHLLHAPIIISHNCYNIICMAGIQCHSVQKCRYPQIPDLCLLRVAWGVIWIPLYVRDKTRSDIILLLCHFKFPLVINWATFVAGGNIASSWAVLQCMGEDGYMDIARRLMIVAERMKNGINAIEVYKMHPIIFGSFTCSVSL